MQYENGTDKLHKHFIDKVVALHCTALSIVCFVDGFCSETTNGYHINIE